MLQFSILHSGLGTGHATLHYLHNRTDWSLTGDTKLVLCTVYTTHQMGEGENMLGGWEAKDLSVGDLIHNKEIIPLRNWKENVLLCLECQEGIHDLASE